MASFLAAGHMAFAGDAQGTGFCAEAQRLVNGAPRPVTNVVLGDYVSFQRSKPQIDPLTTTEFRTVQAGDPPRETMISCKLISADHFWRLYGPQSVAAERPCKVVNEATVDQVLASLSPAERSRLRFTRDQIVLEDDHHASLGPQWLRMPQRVYAADGRLHIQSVSVIARYDDPGLKNAPPTVRGTRNCHLIAPAFVRAMVLGEVPPPSAP